MLSKTDNSETVKTDIPNNEILLNPVNNKLKIFNQV